MAIKTFTNLCKSGGSDGPGCTTEDDVVDGAKLDVVGAIVKGVDMYGEDAGNGVAGDEEETTGEEDSVDGTDVAVGAKK